MTDRGLAGLFDAGSGDDSSSGLEDTRRSLEGLKSTDLPDSITVDEKIRCNKFLPEFSYNLPTGRGRDQLVEHIWWELDEKDGRYIRDEGYDTGDVVDMTVYMLDELDSSGEILGGDLVEYMEEFIKEDGSPGYLEDFTYSGIK